MQQNQISFGILKKVVLVGDSFSGKTSLLTRFVTDTFGQNNYHTIGIEFRSKIIEVQDLTCKLQIWDTAGAERYRSITSSYYRGASGIILVYDVSNRQSFESIIHHLQSIQDVIDKISPHQLIQNIQYMLVGSKIDLKNRQVSTDEGKQFANYNKMIFIEVSSLSSQNVVLAFETLADAMISNQPNPQPQEYYNRISLKHKLLTLEQTPLPAKRYNCI